MKFLGVRYIQSEQCITLDQAAYTCDMLEHYFGTDIDKIKTVRTPMRYDTDYEKELFAAIPLPPEEMKRFVIKYKGGY